MSARDAAMSRALLAWFRANRRDLPWRAPPGEPRDAYRVWVSEVMLQQTQVATVVPYYERFLRRFPSVHALAGADEIALMKAWEGLGLYARARRMHQTARDVVSRGGSFPRSREGLVELHGVGPYMSGAIASLAFNARAPAVDGNVFRVIARLDADSTDVSKPAARASFEARVLGIMPRGRAGEFNEALMELGATVCTPRAPDCGACPVAAWCRGRATPADFPVKATKAAKRSVRIAAALVERDGEVLLVKPERGLMAGVFGLPYAEGDARGLATSLGVARDAVGRPVARVSHTYSHREWRVNLHRVRAPTLGGEWVARDRVGDYPLAGWARKSLREARLL